MREIAPGLHHWSAPHPGWDPDPEPGSAADWPAEVGCTLYQAPGAAVLIDPLVPDELWPALDELVDGRLVVVLTTIRFHGRSREAVLERYGGAKIAYNAEMPEGVEARIVDGFQETMYWLPEPRALVPGDLLIGDGEGGIRMCPASWLKGYLDDAAGIAELRGALQPLLALPVEHVLASHWSPVTGGGHAALERALRD
jgi:hypothetical protein